MGVGRSPVMTGLRDVKPSTPEPDPHTGTAVGAQSLGWTRMWAPKAPS